jgi:ribosome-associated heat shock protein Hsp15
LSDARDGAAARIRLDKWLWHARFFKTRSLAGKVVSEHGVRVNGTRTSKPARAIGPGDVLTFNAGARVRVVRLLEIGTRRGPAPEAQALYDDLSPPPPERDATAPVAASGGRPTKRDRRSMDKFRSGSLD